MNKISQVCLGLTLLTSTAAYSGTPPHVSGELIVKIKKGAENRFFSEQKNLGIEKVRDINLSYGNLTVVRFDQSQLLEDVKKLIENNSNVVFAEPNFIYHLISPASELSIDNILSSSVEKNGLSTPTDPRFSSLWGLKNTGRNEPGRTAPGSVGADIDALRAWAITKGDRSIKIAVIDTGIDYTHVDLNSNMWTNTAELNGKAGVDDDGNGYVDDIHGYDFANNDGDPKDGHGHGTHTAGTIGAVHNNNIGVAGVMADVELVGIKFLTDAGSGTSENAIKSIDYATKLGVDLMSNSWGGGGYSQALKDAIVRASKAGIIFTAAAGNSRSNNDKNPQYPANYNVPNVISVAAHTAQDTLASFSSYGKKTVHIAAPGHNILSTITNDRYKSYSGTSMATPHVSGILGLLLATEGRMEHSEMRERLIATSVPVRALRGKTINGGRVNAYNLLTNTRPERNDPRPGQWQTISIEDIWESAHPYLSNSNEKRTFTIAGAKFIRLRIKKYDLEKRYDYIEVLGVDRQSVEKISGKGDEYISSYVEGNTIHAVFKSDRSVTKWGFVVEELDVQY